MATKPMSADLLDSITKALSVYKFKLSTDGKWLQRGVCPSCGQKELYTKAQAPWYLTCSRKTECQYKKHVKELWPDIFEDYSERARKLQKANPTAPINPNAAAELYLQEGRGFDLELLNKNQRGKTVAPWYKQEWFVDSETNQSTATVRFPFLNGYWERLIDRPERFKSGKARFMSGITFAGKWWIPPSVRLDLANEIWITEGIFNAIALLHHDITAVAIMSSTNYPAQALKDLAAARAQQGKSGVTLVWALDSDIAGQKAIRQFMSLATDDGWECKAAQVPFNVDKQHDWNDQHQLGKLEPDDIQECFYYGALLIAKSAKEKGLLMYAHKDNGHEFPFAFDSQLWWFEVDLPALTKALKDVPTDDDEMKQEVIKENSKVHTIATCLPVPLYFQQNQLTDESWYYFKVDFPNAPQIKNTFTASQLNGASPFSDRLLHIAPGGLYEGSTAMLRRYLKPYFKNIKHVKTIDYIGYSDEYKAYVLGDVAVKDGQIVKINKEDYFVFHGNLMLKSLSKSTPLKINPDVRKLNTQWPDLLWRAFGVRGYIALSFWFGSLFAEQLRAMHESLFFMELVGDPAAGKTTLISFLWRLFGRTNYEGFDPSKSSAAGRARNLAQVSNMPIILIESDRESQANDKKPHVKAFDWDELKTIYNGRSTRSRGVANGGNETYEPPFRGALVISQNNPVQSSDAIMQRINQIFFNASDLNETTREAAKALKEIPTEELSSFILKAACTEHQTLELIKKRTAQYEHYLMQHNIVKEYRLALNHAQLMAMAEALAPLVGTTEAQLKETWEFIKGMAAQRQKVIQTDSQAVQDFWETYDYIQSKNDKGNGWLLNHSSNSKEIAINLNHYYAKAKEANQNVATIAELKKALKNSRRYKFIEQKTVHSSITDKTVYCWVFKKP